MSRPLAIPCPECITSNRFPDQHRVRPQRSEREDGAERRHQLRIQQSYVWATGRGERAPVFPMMSNVGDQCPTSGLENPGNLSNRGFTVFCGVEVVNRS